MGKIQINSGQSNTVTHHAAQSSCATSHHSAQTTDTADMTTRHPTQVVTTQKRHYISRPAHFVANTTSGSAQVKPPVAPSRLINLGIHAADLKNPAPQQTSEMTQKSEPIQTPTTPQSISTSKPTKLAVATPRIIELGNPNVEKNIDPDSTGLADRTDEDKTKTIVEPKSTSTKPAKDPIETKPLDTVSAKSEPVKNDSLKTDTTKTTPDHIDTADLAANIAADYASTNLRLTAEQAQENSTTTPTGDSIEAIALATSNAIASIREATEPDQISKQITSLKAFAEDIKSKSTTPEMRELSDTIDKFVSIAMKSTKFQEESINKVTLSSKATRAAAKVTKSSAKVMAAKSRAKAPATSTRAKTPARQATATRSTARRRTTARATTNTALKNAIESVATMEDRNATTRRKTQKAPTLRKKTATRRFVIALACATACVVAVIALVGSNIPDISVRVAAMQTGIQASYPSYIPRDYTLSNISSEDGKITMVFNGPDNTSFKLVEEKSSWDSSALLHNYVEPSWGEEYAATHEQGITIYISNASSGAAWVNGGVLYRISSSSNTTLTKKQIRNIVTSL